MSESFSPRAARFSFRTGRHEDGPESTSANSPFPSRRYRPTASQWPRKFKSIMDVPDGSEAPAGEFSEVSDISSTLGMLSRADGQFKCEAIGVAKSESIVQNL